MSTLQPTKTFDVELPWEREACFTRLLLHDPTQKAQFHKIDLFHTVTLGIGKNHASCLALLQDLMPGASLQVRFQKLTEMYMEFCKEPWSDILVKLSCFECFKPFGRCRRSCERKIRRHATCARSTERSWDGQGAPRLLLRGIRVRSPRCYANLWSICAAATP